MIASLFALGMLLVHAVQSASVIDRVSVQDGAICDDRIPAYLVADGQKASNADNKVVHKDVDEQECKNMCTDNKDEQGNQVMCSSFTYDIKERSCAVHRGKAIPVGKLELKQSSGHRYYEKFCLPEGTPAECGEAPFFRADQAVLIGFAKNVSHTKHLSVCVQACLEMSAECRSAMFFGGAGECILSVASAQDAPDVFADEEDEENVVYFENGCVLGNQVRSQKKHSVPKQKEILDPKKGSSVKLANSTIEWKPTNASKPIGSEQDKEENTEKEKEKDKDNDSKKGQQGSNEKRKTNDKSEEDAGAAVRPKKPSLPESSEEEHDDKGDKGAGDDSQESKSKRVSPKPNGSKQRVTSEPFGRKSPKNGGSKKLLQNASLSNNDGAWGRWSEECRSFDERRPCQNGNRVGFQSRQCLRTPFECQGPFFRYCIAPC